MKYKLKIYNSKTIKMTEKYRARFAEIAEKQRKKYENDKKYGGVNDSGYFVVLHYR